MASFTIVTDDDERTVDGARAGTSVRIATGDLDRVTGWTLKPEGLCRGEVCVPVRDRGALLVDGAVDLQGFADALRRPFVVDAEVDIAALGASVPECAEDRRAMHVPGDAVLNDFDGNEHRWSELGRKKKLLFAWASW